MAHVRRSTYSRPAFRRAERGTVIGPLWAQLVAGKVPGRRSPEEITVFKQNSDQGVGFMALAKLAHDKARAAGLGMEI